MEKVARKPSSDPVQEKLRQNKEKWNKEVSTFINDLINFKKLMNGWPNKFHMEKSSIKEPVPADPATILGVLAGDFQELAQKGNDITKQQIEYAKGRRKNQPKAPTAPAAPSGPTEAPVAPPAPDLSQQLTAPAGLDYLLIAEGSNPLTRFWSSLKGPWFGSAAEARSRKYRLSMLKASAELHKQLEKFEQEIVGSTPESIFTAGKMLFKIENQLFYLTDTLASLKVQSATPKGESAPPPVTEDEAPPVTDAPVATQDVSPDDPAILAAKVAILDFRKSMPNFTNLNPALVRNFSGLVIKFVESPNNIKVQLSPQVMQAYQALIADTNMRNGTNSGTLAEILMTKSASYQLEAVAQNFITKWLGTVKHKISPFDKTSALRLDLLKISSESRKTLNQIMNSLEKDVDVKMLTNYIDLLDKNLTAMRHLMRPLENTIRGKMFDKTFLNMLQNKKLTDYDFGLDPKQKQHLEKMIQTKQFRDLTNIYSRPR